MASVKVTEEAVSLPAGPVDFDALCAALKAGKSGEEAVLAATKNNPVPEQVATEVVEAAPAAITSTETE
jgi:hypothetical protein